MDTYDFTHKTNATFVQTFELSNWCDLYDLSAGVWFSMLRADIDSSIAHYLWSTANGRIEYSETLAYGEITFTLNPLIGDTLMIGATIIEFGASDGVEIGGNLATTMANLLAFLNASDDVDVSRCTYAVTSGSILGITYKTAGSLGNAFPFETDVAGATESGSTESGSTLSGGGGVVTLTSPVEDIEMFDGDYVYDVRFQGFPDEVLVPVVGGTITFEPGVTRNTPEEVS